VRERTPGAAAPVRSTPGLDADTHPGPAAALEGRARYRPRPPLDEASWTSPRVPCSQHRCVPGNSPAQAARLARSLLFSLPRHHGSGTRRGTCCWSRFPDRRSRPQRPDIGRYPRHSVHGSVAVYGLAALRPARTARVSPPAEVEGSRVCGTPTRLASAVTVRAPGSASSPSPPRRPLVSGRSGQLCSSPMGHRADRDASGNKLASPSAGGLDVASQAQPWRITGQSGGSPACAGGRGIIVRRKVPLSVPFLRTIIRSRLQPANPGTCRPRRHARERRLDNRRAQRWPYEASRDRQSGALWRDVPAAPAVPGTFSPFCSAAGAVTPVTRAGLCISTSG
jgi:hypothetical protein